jgi:glycosyltransferase involved in cell wall biosynthesis
MNITYLVHGFPPFENAGTEQHTATLCTEMHSRGHTVTVIAATRQVGRLHGEVLQDLWNGISVYRIVNNIPALALEQSERRPEMERIIGSLIPTNTDILHIQHTQFLSSRIPFKGPKFWTLHDAWGWCPSGGTRLRNGTTLCKNPSPTDCLQCYAEWQPHLPKTGQLIMRLASTASPWISPQRLHKWWKKLPTTLRRPISMEKKTHIRSSIQALKDRNQSFTQLAKECQQIISPSLFLMDLAKNQTWKNVRCISHGIAQTEHWNSHKGGHGLLFVGSMVHHKGPQLVEKAYRKAFPNASVPIQFVGSGPIKVTLPHTPSISNQAVYERLQKADALVMGSIWEENYPVILLEAKAVGCPVVAPRAGGIPEIIEDGVDGILYTLGKVDELSQALQAILKQKWNVRPPKTSASMALEYEALYEGAL